MLYICNVKQQQQQKQSTMKTKKVYGAIAAKTAKMEKEIVSYAEALKSEKDAEDYLVGITGFDFMRDAMKFELSLKYRYNGRINYIYIKGIAVYMDFSDEVNISVSDYDTEDMFEESRKVAAPSRHSFEQVMMNF